MSSEERARSEARALHVTLDLPDEPRVKRARERWPLVAAVERALSAGQASRSASVHELKLDAWWDKP